ncbi:hypothetical protein GCM10009735_53420 [Actinomadura chokoriensis]
MNPAFRGTGLARRLYGAFFALARSDGRSTVRALTSPQELVNAVEGVSGSSVRLVPRCSR